MLKFLIILIFFVTPIFAVDSIYAWGYGSDLKNMLTSIKFFTANASYLISATIGISILMVMYKETKEDNTQRIIKVVFLALVVSQLFFHSKKDYMVEDEVTSQTFVVTDIPIGIGELFSLFTTAERVLLKAFETSYSTPNSLNFSQSGLGFSMAAHLSTNNIMFVDGNSHETFMDYTTNCIASGMLNGQIDKNIIASEDIVGSIRVQGFETLVYKPDGTIEQMSCQDSYDNYIVKYFKNESNSYIQNRIGAQMALDPTKAATALQATSKLFFGVSKSGLDYVKQQMGRNMLKKGLQTMAMTTGGDTQALAYTSAVSNSTLNNQWQQAGIMAQSTLPMIKAYITSMVLALTPVLALLSIMFADWKYIKLIITLLITLMLFSPLASVINYLIYLKLEKIIPVISQHLWMPMLAMRDVNSQIYTYLNFLGYAAMSIPLLAYSLVKASEQGFVNFMSGMGGSVSAAANTGASQKVLGANIGNTRVGSGSYTGINGTRTNMGGGATQTDSIQSSAEGTYKDITTTSANGDSNSTISNSIADFTTHDGKLSNVAYKNITGEITTSQQNSFNQAKAEETNTLKTLTNTLSDGLSKSMTKGQIFTNSDDFSKDTGINKADSKAIVDAQNEAMLKAINKKISNDVTTSESSAEELRGELGARLTGGGLFGKITEAIGFKIDVGGGGTFTGRLSDGKNESISLSKDEVDNLQHSVSDSLSKTLSENEGLTLRTSKALSNNEVFSDGKLQTDMNAYTQAHSTAEKYSENYSKTDSNSASFASKVMPTITKQFIEQDERLKAMYESGDNRARKDALNDATNRIDTAYHNAQGSDYNTLNTIFKTQTGFDLKGNISDSVNQELKDGKNLSQVLNNKILNGSSEIREKQNLQNTINKNPKDEYNNKSSEFKNNTNKEMEAHKKAKSLGTGNIIDKTGANLSKEVIKDLDYGDTEEILEIIKPMDEFNSSKGFTKNSLKAVTFTEEAKTFVADIYKESTATQEQAKIADEIKETKEKIDKIEDDISDSQYEQIPQTKRIWRR